MKLSKFREFQNLSAEHYRIAVIDHDEKFRYSFREILENLRYEVVTVADVLEFSKFLEQGMFDMLILDVCLPWIDGIELCQLLKQHPTWHRRPILFLSHQNDSEVVKEALEAGANEYLFKPICSDQLKVVCEKYLPPSVLCRRFLKIL